MPTCKTCQRDLPETAFALHDAGGRHRTHCKECKKAYSRKWYRANKARSLEWVHANKERYKKDAEAYIAECHKNGCVVCGEDTSICLDFHHVDPQVKRFCVSERANGYAPLETIKAEIAKCVVICSNCHRKLHAGLITCPSIPSLS